MTGTLLRALGLAAVLGLGLVPIALFTPASHDRLLDGYVLAFGGLLLLALVRVAHAAAGAAGQSAYELALRRQAGRIERPAELEKLEREVVLAAGNAFDVHARLRPLLRQIAEHRLESRRGLRLDDGAPGTRSLLGENLWELVRPDREPPDDRSGPGLPLDRLRAHLTALERL